MIRTISFTAEFVSGGGIAELYRGEKTLSLNVAQDEPADSIQERAREYARDLIAKEGCLAKSQVEIKHLAIHE